MWSNLNTRHETLAYNLLEKLEIYADLKSFLEIIDQIQQLPANADEIVNTYCQKWYSEEIKTFGLFETKRWYRRLYAVKIEHYLQSIKHSNSTGLVKNVNEALAEMTLSMLEYSILQNNFSMAKKYCDILEQSSGKLSNKITSQSRLNKSKLYLLKYSEQIQNSSVAKIETLYKLLLKSWSTVNGKLNNYFQY